jgi:lipoate synthase
MSRHLRMGAKITVEKYATQNCPYWTDEIKFLLAKNTCENAKTENFIQATCNEGRKTRQILPTQTCTRGCTYKTATFTNPAGPYCLRIQWCKGTKDTDIPKKIA